MVSLLLLLGCLSIQTVSLQDAQRLATLSRLRLAEDGLSSAAQKLVAALATQHSCLLPLPKQQWSEASCVSAAQLASLAKGEVNAEPYELVGWQPQSTPASSAQLLMELQPADGQPALRSAFAVALQGSPPQVRNLRLLGLRGVQP